MVIFYSANNKHIPKTSGKENKHVPKMGQTCSQDGANMFPRWGKHVPRMGQTCSQDGAKLSSGKLCIRELDPLY